MAARVEGAAEMVLTVPDDATVSGFTRIRWFVADGRDCYVASDVAACMGITNVHSTLAGFPEDEKGIHFTATPGGRQRVVVVYEPGLWRLIVGSRVKKAEPFKRWLVWDVLPSIRKYGCYPPPKVVPAERPPAGCDWADVVRTLADSQSEIATVLPGVERKVDALAGRVELLGEGVAFLMKEAAKGTPALPEPAPAVRCADRTAIKAGIVAELERNPRRTNSLILVVLVRDHRLSADVATVRRTRRTLESRKKIPITPLREASDGRWVKVQYREGADGLDDTTPIDRSRGV